MPDFKLTINNSTRKVDLICESYLEFNDPRVVELLVKCDFMHALTPLDQIKFDRVGITLRWKYEISLIDGRNWDQDINYDSPEDPDPPMTFLIEDEWRKTEFSRQRDIRDILTNLKASHGLNKAVIEYGDFA